MSRSFRQSARRRMGRGAVSLLVGGLVVLGTTRSPSHASDRPGPIHVEKIDHVVVTVKDLEGAEAFYRDLTGQEFYPLEPLALEGYGVEAAALAASGLELVKAGPGGEAAAFIKRAGEAVLGIAFKVADMDQALEAAGRRGLRPLARGRNEVREVAVFDPADSFGVMLEFVEYVPGYSVADLEIVNRWREAKGLGELQKLAAGSPTMSVQAIDHVLVFVRDIEKARGLFADLFGTRFPEPHSRDGGRSVLSVDGLGIELLASTAPDSGINRFIDRRRSEHATGEGVAYVSMKVDSYEDAHSALSARGYREVATTKVPTRKVALMVRDQGAGIGFEIIEYRRLAHPLVAQEMLGSLVSQADRGGQR